MVVIRRAVFQLSIKSRVWYPVHTFFVESHCTSLVDLIVNFLAKGFKNMASTRSVTYNLC